MENTAGCIPPSTRTCDAIGCYCVTQTTIPTPKPFPVCAPPETAICHGFDCHCGVPPAPATLQPAVMPDDGCAIVATVIVVGIKKILVACWMGG